MRKIYLLVTMLCVTFISFAQVESTWFLPSGIPDDWKTNPYPKSVYVIQKYDGFDPATQDVMDIWSQIPNDGSCDKYIMKTSGRRLPTDASDLTAKWKAVYDDVNLYVLQKVTDDHIAVTTSSATSESWELQISTYPDSVPRSVYVPLAVDPTPTKTLDQKQCLGYWTKLGSYYLYADAIGAGHAIDYSQAYNGTINWSIPLPGGINAKFTQLDENNYTILWTLPLTALNSFVPSKNAAISIDVKVIDFDPDQVNSICASSNSDNDNVYMTMFYSGIGTFNETPISTNNVSMINNQDEVHLYPNPVKDKLSIQSDSKINSVSIIDVNGRAVKSLGLINGQIDVKDIPKGLYIVKMQNTSSKTYIRKIIIE